MTVSVYGKDPSATQRLNETRFNFRKQAGMGSGKLVVKYRRLAGLPGDDNRSGQV